MAFPNLIVAGVPRAGTTALFEYLVGHPEVCGSDFKETCFFVDPGYWSEDQFQRSLPNINTHELDAYQDSFQRCEDSRGTRIIVDASPDFVYQNSATEMIPQLPSDPKLIFLVRNPADRLLSLYRFAIGNQARLPADTTFDQFVAMLRREDAALPPGLRYSLVFSDYDRYIRRFEAVVGQDRIMVLLFENLIADPQQFMSELADRLGIDAGHYSGFEPLRTNASVAFRNQSLHRLIRRMPLPNSIRLSNSRLKSRLRSVYYSLNSFHMDGVPDAHLSLLVGFDREFAESVRRLEEHFDLDLNIWRIGRS